MSKLPGARITERKEIYIESLERWVEIAVLDEAYLYQTVIANLHLEDQELDEYYYSLLKIWPGLDTATRLELSLKPEAVREVAEKIIKENPSLHPRELVQILDRAETPTISELQVWFDSHGKHGTRPEVIHGTATQE